MARCCCFELAPWRPSRLGTGSSGKNPSRFPSRTIPAPSPSSSSPQEANQTRRIVSFLRVALIQAATRAATCLPLAERSTAAADQRQDPLLLAAFVLPSLFHVDPWALVGTFPPNC